jgi:hypothetical protein
MVLLSVVHDPTNHIASTLSDILFSIHNIFFFAKLTKLSNYGLVTVPMTKYYYYNFTRCINEN